MKRLATHRQHHRPDRLRVSMLVLFAALMPFVQLDAQLAVGHWRDHLSYNNMQQVCTAGSRVIAAAQGGLLCYDTDDNTLQRLNKTRGLNDVGIATFAYDKQSKWMVVAYNNANIDLIDNDDHVTNLSDIKRNDIAGNKKINNIRFRNHCAYLACGFGIVVLDLNRSEIKETYYLGANGTYKNVNDIAFTDSLIVAATDDGLLYARKESTLLNVAANWHPDTLSLLAGRPVQMLAVNGNKLLALSMESDDTTLYRETGALAFAPWLAGGVRTMKSDDAGTIIVCRNNAVEIYDSQYQLRHSVGDIDWMDMDAHDATLGDDGTLWIAHSWAGLAACNLYNPAATLTTHTATGPLSDYVYRMVSWDDNLMVCPGGHSTTYTGTYLPANIYTYNSKRDRWSGLDNDNGTLNGIYDIVDVAVNPYNGNTMTAAAWGSGLVEVVDNQAITLYNQHNSDGALEPYSQGDYSTLLTGAVAYDRQGNLWSTLSLKANGLAVHYKQGGWKSFNTQAIVGNSEIDHLLCDSIHDYKLFWGRANKIFVHDGDSKMAYIDPNQGSKLTTSTVTALVQDHNGNLWLGTNKGVKVIYDLHRAFQNGGEGEKAPVSCNNVLYNENGINEYLLAYESITCIAVDGANRKWVGTAAGGIYLLSANGLEQLEHFTTTNSPLFADKIVSISIMPWTGEVFIGTNAGVQSYRGTATYAYGEPQDDIHAFPNPVQPDYDGPIAIKGFTRNGLVHITDAAGHTIYSTTSNGGEAIWNGRTLDGHRVASGVYYVFASAPDGTRRSVAKILIVR